MGPMDQMDAEDFARTLEVNRGGVFYGIKHAARAMKAGRGAGVPRGGWRRGSRAHWLCIVVHPYRWAAASSCIVRQLEFCISKPAEALQHC